MIYAFAKSANIPQLTTELTKVGLTSPLISNIASIGTIISITASRNLSPAEYAVLYKAVLAHIPPNPVQAMVEQKVQSAMQFGQQFLIEFAAQNILMGFTTAQISQMLSKYGYIMSMMQSGSLYTALQAIQAINPDDLINPARKQECITKIKAYLGIP